jgi:hypothetical protein
MATRSGIRKLTVRMPAELHASASALARGSRKSLNELLLAGLGAMVSEAEAQQRFEAYSQLGADAEANVEFAAHAQAEVMLRDE